MRRSSRLASANKDTRHTVVHIPPGGLEVSVHTAYEEHPMSRLADKPHGLGFEDNAEDSDRERKFLSTLEPVVEAAQAV